MTTRTNLSQTTEINSKLVINWHSFVDSNSKYNSPFVFELKVKETNGDEETNISIRLSELEFDNLRHALRHISELNMNRGRVDTDDIF
jgi:hypothetical protein